MDYVKKAIWGPDPKEQMRKCQMALRKNKRQIEKQIQELTNLQKKTKTLIKSSLKKNDLKTAKLYAREYRNITKTNERMNVSKATIDSIGFKLNEQQQLIKLKGSMSKSTEIMKQVNSLVNLPQLSSTVQELSKELMKSGIIDEMVDDILDTNIIEDEDEEEEDEEIELVLKSILNEDKDKSQSQTVTVDDKLPEMISSPVLESSNGIEQDDDDDAMLANMRQRLSALQE
ncbi:hypothetical protein CANARDRAFT_27706, partial [[Candida] arabinofermentans NRRL YB-2248]